MLTLATMSTVNISKSELFDLLLLFMRLSASWRFVNFCGGSRVVGMILQGRLPFLLVIMLPVLKKMGQITKTIVNSHGSKVKSFFLLPGTDQTVLRKARGVEVAP